MVSPCSFDGNFVVVNRLTLLAVYPAFVMIGGRIIMKEKLSRIQYILLLGIIAGSVMVVASNVF